MTKNHPEIDYCCLQDSKHHCRHGIIQDKEEIRPLSKACCSSRLKVCKVRGDRRSCARMADLGVLPGSELEVLCASGGHHRQCMVKINGGTISLDGLSAENILVSPL